MPITVDTGLTSGTRGLSLAAISGLSYGSSSGGGGGGGPLPPYTGPVATAAGIPNTLSSTASSSAMTRKAHFSRDAITSLQLMYPNWYVDIASGSTKLGAEVGAGNSILVDAWIEYPTSTYTQVKFSGGNTATIASLSQTLSDALSIAIPDNTQFYTWTYVRPTGGNNYPYNGNSTTTGSPLYTSGGEACNRATSSVPTTPGAITDNQSGKQGYWPAAILGTTTKHTYALMGDSICQGQLEVADASFDLGVLARSVGTSRGYINLGVGGDTMSSVITSSTNRTALMNYCSVVLDEHGINSILSQNATRGAGALAYNKRFATRWNGKRFRFSTLCPKSTSSNSFINAAGQTVLSAQNTARELINTDRRANTLGINYFETAYPVEDSPGNGKWKSDGSTTFLYTPDGTHPSQYGSLAIQSSGNVSVSAVEADSVLALSAYDTTLQVLSGSASYSAAKFGNGISGAYYTYIDGIVPATGAFTYECWMSSASIPGALAYIFSGAPVSVNVQTASGFVGMLNGDSTQSTSTVNVCDGALHHIAVTGTTAGVFTLWVDGASAATYTNASLTRSQWNCEAVAFAIKYRAIASNVLSSAFSAAVVDEVAIFNTNKYTGAFTPPSSPYTGSESNLVCLWHLNDDLAGVNGPAF